MDSFTYIRNLVLSMYTVGCLPEALKATRERLSSDLYFLIEQTIVDVENQRAELVKQAMQLKPKPMSANVPDFLSGAITSEDEVVFNQLVHLLFRRIYALMQTFKYIYTILQWIQTQDNVQIAGGIFFSLDRGDIQLEADGFPFLDFDINELWTLVQNEVKAFLYSYFSSIKPMDKPVTAMDALSVEGKKSMDNSVSIPIFLQMRMSN